MTEVRHDLSGLRCDISAAPANPLVWAILTLLLWVPMQTFAQDAGNLPPTPTSSQVTDWCGTQKRWAEKQPAFTNEAAACPTYGPCDVAGTRNAYIPDPGQSTTIIRLMFHIITLDNGTNASTTPAMIEAQVANLNADYAPVRIEFEYQYQTHASSAYRSLNEGEFDLMKAAYAVQPDSMLNVFVSYVEPSYSYGTFPWDPQCLTVYGGIVMTTGHFSNIQSTLAHEVGHCLGLWHTHHGVSEVNECSQCYEKANSPDGDVTGDLCEDTEPTPLSYGCGGPGGNDPCNSQPWGLTDPQNYMGYAGEGCWSEFSPQQMGRAHCWLNDQLLGWSSGVRFTHTNVLGPAPHVVDFNGITGKTVNAWTWDFGDGQTSNQQSPTHEYSDAGLYDVTVAIQATDGQYETVRRELVWVYSDSMVVGSPTAVPGTSNRIDIYARNHLPLQEIMLPISWDGPVPITFDSVTTTGLRTNYLSVQEYAHYDDYSKRITYRLAVNPNGSQAELAPGTGPVLSAYFTMPPGTSTDCPISLVSYSNIFNTFSPRFTVLPGNYDVTAIAGELTACIPGDINNNGFGPDVSDLSYLISYFTGAVPSLPNPAAANVNGTGTIDLSDLSYLILYMVAGGNPPVCSS
ncbi:MAG: PKD domain-containing protein [candidate division Zixibacteria bacterium]|nr:PKD domain-containing protein [candidate division Zixibacteria bacterium]